MSWRHIFDAIAWPEFSSDGSVLTLRLHCASPCFRLAAHHPLVAKRASARSGLLNDENPVELVFADMVLSIVRGGYVTAQDVEVVGFLFRIKTDGIGVKPVFMDDSVGRRNIVGAWALCETDVCTASAIFAAESSSSSKPQDDQATEACANRRKSRKDVLRSHNTSATDGARMLRASDQ
jgi:hypothetical protein